jgi:8-oxo-dGTP pyrophosphatase MutT (NUDIX family)
MKSVGVILFRYTKGKWKTVIVKRKYTYAFIEFIKAGKKLLDKKYVRDIAKSMTIRELEELRTTDFETIYKEFCGTVNDYSRWCSELWKRRGNDWIKSICPIRDTPWELPKGKLKRKEDPLIGAMREFKEETSIHECDYRLTSAKIDHRIINNSKMYNYTYYIGYCNQKKLYKSKIDRWELIDVKWESLENLGFGPQIICMKALEALKNEGY